VITSFGSIRDVLADAEPQDKADVYQDLGLRLTYDPGKQLVRTEAQLDPHKLGIRSVSEGRVDH
jgi:hypothetical protein